MASKRKSAKKNLKARRRRARKAFFLCLFLFALLALITRLLVFVPVKMETNAMQPVYQQNDVVFASRLAMLRGDAIARGEDVYAYFAAANRQLCAPRGRHAGRSDRRARRPEVSGL